MTSKEIDASFPAWLLRFVQLLRNAAVPVSSTETADAVASLAVIDLDSRIEVQNVLCTTLAKTPEQHSTLLELLPPFWEGMQIALEQSSTAEEPLQDNLDFLADNPDQFSLTALREQILQAIRDDLTGQFQDLARLTIAGFGEQEISGRPRGISMYRIRQALQLRQDLELPQTAAARAPVSTLRNSNRYSANIELFEQALRNQLQRRQAEDLSTIEARSLAAIGRRTAMLEQQDPQAVRKAVYALRRSLRSAGQQQNQRGKRHQQIDLRRTVRQSLATGGVPMNPALRHRRPQRPKLFVLCDVSTSVSTSTSFFLSVLQGMHELFPKTRCFAFVERVAEITKLMKGNLNPKELSSTIDREAHVVDRSGYTDYGRIWLEFHQLIAKQLDQRSTIVILGDARTNGREPAAADFAKLTKLARKTVWINPEPESYWNLGDSVVSSYVDVCEMFPCWSAAQLTEVVRQLA